MEILEDEHERAGARDRLEQPPQRPERFLCLRPLVRETDRAAHAFADHA
jgi:hypothetical protein